MFDRICYRRKMILAACLIGALSASSVLAYTADWEWQNPLPTSNLLNSVQFLDANTLVAVGDAGQVLRSTDQGASWAMVPNSSFVTFSDVSFCDALHGVAVGDGGTLVTADGGLTWAEGDPGVTGLLTGVSSLNPTTAVLVGRIGRIRRSTDGGLTWTALASSTNSHLYGVDFPDELTGYAVGDLGTIVKTSDGGDTWTTLDSGSSAYLRGVDFVDANNGWVVGTSGVILATTDGGGNWTPQVAGTTASLQSVVMTAGGQGFALSFTGDIVQHTTDGGVNWTTQSTGLGDTERTLKVATIDGVHDMIVGGGGSLSRTDDAGANWSRVGSGYRGDLTDLEAIDGSRAIAVGNEGAVLKTSDSGTTWNEMPVETAVNLFAVEFGTINAGIISGDYGTILRTRDGGNNWSVHGTGTSHKLYDVHMYGSDLAVAVGQQGRILTTTDGGANWTVRDPGVPENLRGVWMVNSTTVFAVGESGLILRSTDFGVSWSTIDSGVYQQLLQVHFLNENVGFILGTYTPVLLRTEDGGLTWTEYEGNVVGMSRMDFMDDKVGLIVGEGQMLSTFDGGISWNVEPAAIQFGLLGVQITAAGRATAVGTGGTIITSELDPQIVLTGTVYAGNNAFVYLGNSGILLIFDQVTVGGEVTVTIRPDGPYLGEGYSPTISPLYYDFQNTAEFSGEVTIYLPYDEADLRGPESEVRLMHYDATADPPDYVDITTAVLTLDNQVKGTTSSFSPFAVAEAWAPTTVRDDTPASPGGLAMVVPNPFNPRTTISFDLGRPGLAKLAVYDVRGYLVTVLAERNYPAGRHELVWDGRDQAGRAVDSGVYLVRMTAADVTKSRKILLLR